MLNFRFFPVNRILSYLRNAASVCCLFVYLFEKLLVYYCISVLLLVYYYH